MNDKMEQFVKWVEESDNIVFFGGAGVSTESGIPNMWKQVILFLMKRVIIQCGIRK